jgi:hypothetical protein
MPSHRGCHIFLGPTLAAAEAARELDAVYLPPVREGDVLRLLRRARPRAIGIIDGYFRAVPACWHKEILFALSEGVHVFGAASMGALRAAELDRFGMVGVGRIYEGYRAGTFPPYAGEAFEDDDEVAIVHGPAETGYVAASEAMVDIRATLAEATARGIVPPTLRDALAAFAKQLHYPERSLARVLATARAQRPGERGLDALERWLPGGRVELKRADARLLLATLRRFLASDPPPFAAAFTLERSAAWRAATAASRLVATDDGPTLPDLVRDEALLEPGGLAGLRRRATERLSALETAERHGIEPGESATRASITALRGERGLLRHQQLEAWLAARDLDRTGLERLAVDEARLARLTELTVTDAGDCLLDLLRLDDGYLDLRARAIAKRDDLEAVPVPSLDDEAVRELVAWHALQRQNVLPADGDAYARGLGFRDGPDLARALWRERAWRRQRDAARIGPAGATE